ncbi:hypothetical protein [Patulibacter defluvii]|uniref:hypothetical protein n=1 Tax=Patulibacter defluvii TaxID=3095358 RepID=UPI002A75CF4B|nr:hypothetical protein [Patulibacter sp. DM4]
MESSLVGTAVRRAGARSEAPPPDADPSAAAGNLLTQARDLAALALRSSAAEDVIAHAEALQRSCAQLAEAPLPDVRRRRRDRLAVRIEALALAADDLAAVVLLRCDRAPAARERAVVPDVGPLMARIAERHERVLDALGPRPAAAPPVARRAA